MFTITTQAQATIRQVAPNKLVRNYVTKATSPNVSLAVMEVSNYKGQETTEYLRIYYVLEGSAQLTCEGQEVTLMEGDSCTLEKGTIYTLRGSFKLIVVNQPAFGI